MGRLDLPDKVRDEDRAFWTEDKLEPRVGYMVVEDDGSITPMAGQSISPLPGDILLVTIIGHA